MTIIVWDGVVTFLILKVISLFTSLRMSDEELLIGDLAIHGEEAYPPDEGIRLAHSDVPAVSGPPSALVAEALVTEEQI